MSAKSRKAVMAARSTLAVGRDLTRREVRAILARLCEAVEELEREACETRQRGRETDAAILDLQIQDVPTR
jgi:hypothetical protein